MGSIVPLAGGRITAAMLASIAPLGVIKGADESLVSNVTLQNDNDLVVPVAANATYLFKAYLNYEGDSIANAGMKIQWSGPAGYTQRYTLNRLLPGNPASTIDATASFTGATVVGMGTTGAGTLRGTELAGSIFTGSAAGTLQLLWAQNATSAVATIMHAQSTLELWRMS